MSFIIICRMFKKILLKILSFFKERASIKIYSDFPFSFCSCRANKAKTEQLTALGNNLKNLLTMSGIQVAPTEYQSAVSKILMQHIKAPPHIT